MGTLWDRRSATAEDVRLALAQRHPMKESTVRTILKRLEEKGYVELVPFGCIFTQDWYS